MMNEGPHNDIIGAKAERKEHNNLMITAMENLVVILNHVILQLYEADTFWLEML